MSIQPGTPSGPAKAAPGNVIVETHPARIAVYSVARADLEALRTNFVSVAFPLFAMFFGIAVTLAITIATVTIDAKSATYFDAGLMASGLLAVITGVQAFRDWRQANKTFKRIVDETT